MAEAAMQGANRTSGAIWGSVSCSKKHFDMQLSSARNWDLNQRRSDHELTYFFLSEAQEDALVLAHEQ